MSKARLPSRTGLSPSSRSRCAARSRNGPNEIARPSAEAHLTGELAVCAGSCGPGNLHLINGLFDFHRSRVLVLGIAAHIPSPEIGAAATVFMILLPF
jgi:hypothetical protein